MRFKLVFLVLAALFGSIGLARATAYIHIDLSSQTMHVNSSSGSYSWPVSTARAGYSTPRGFYAPTGMQLMHYSRKYHMSPMPYSIFFRGGYAIHGTYATGALGRPASHGCVRLAPGNARLLYGIVQREGGRISITGAPSGRGGRQRPPALRDRSARRRAHLHHRRAIRQGRPLGLGPPSPRRLCGALTAPSCLVSAEGEKGAARSMGDSAIAGDAIQRVRSSAMSHQVSRGPLVCRGAAAWLVGVLAPFPSRPHVA
jgi:hypothetical protein